MNKNKNSHVNMKTEVNEKQHLLSIIAKKCKSCNSLKRKYSYCGCCNTLYTFDHVSLKRLHDSTGEWVGFECMDCNTKYYDCVCYCE